MASTLYLEKLPTEWTSSKRFRAMAQSLASQEQMSQLRIAGLCREAAAAAAAVLLFDCYTNHFANATLRI